MSCECYYPLSKTIVLSLLGNAPISFISRGFIGLCYLYLKLLVGKSVFLVSAILGFGVLDLLVLLFPGR